MDLRSPLLMPILSLLAGVLVLVQPQLLSYTVAIYLIVIGILGLAPHFIH